MIKSYLKFIYISFDYLYNNLLHKYNYYIRQLRNKSTYILNLMYFNVGSTYFFLRKHKYNYKYNH